MRYMLLLFPAGYENVPVGTLPEPQVLRARIAFTTELKKAGILVEAHSLHPPAISARLTSEPDGQRVETGPFANQRETLGAYWVFKADSLDEAIEVARGCPALLEDVIEVRRFLSADDFR